MKKQLLSLLALMPLLGSAQIFTENWDGAGPGIGSWSLINVDGLVPAEDVNYVTDAWVTRDRGGEAPNFGGPDGDFAAVSTSWYTPAGTANDWLVSPTINLAGQTTAFLAWDAKAQDVDFPDGYEVRLSTNGGNTVADFTVVLFTTAAEETTWQTRTADLTAYVGQNVRIAFVNNSDDKFVLLIDNIAVTADEPVLPFPSPYCNINVVEDMEPITLVSFANINNVTDATVDGSPTVEDFTAMVVNVSQGQSYPVAFEGNTAGDFEDFFTVYVDWNQNESFLDEGEEYQIGSVTNSTGADAMQAVGNVEVPLTALTGNTRMRVVKSFDDFAEDPCEPSSFFFFGQAEDYTVNVTALGTGSFDNNNFSYFPNPVKNILNLSYSQNIDNVQVFNLLGQSVFNKSFDTTQAQVDMSNFPSGNYMVKITADNAVKVIKIVK